MPSFLAPAGWNKTQRVGVFLGVASTLAAIALHNPTYGYVTGTSFDTPRTAMPLGVRPPKLTYEQAQAGTKEEFDEYARESDVFNSAYNKNLAQYHTVEFSVLDWSSNGALIRSMAPIKMVILFFGIILIFTGFWLWIFSTPKNI
jgi:hypothetical protein